MLMDVDQFDDPVNGPYDVTRIEVPGLQQRAALLTHSTLDMVTSIIKTVDARFGLGIGTTCNNDAGVLDYIYPTTKYPMLKCSMIFNSSLSTLRDYVFNSSYLISAEDVQFFDPMSNVHGVALMVVLKDAQPRRILTNLLYSDLCAILGAVDVPVP